MNMKPFNLEAAKSGESIGYRDNNSWDKIREAVLIAHVPEAHEEQRVVVRIGNQIECFSEHSNHLVMMPKKRTIWVNLYDNITDNMCAWYDTEIEADSGCMNGRIGNRAWPLEIEE